MSKGRMEAFSDGVLAIIITIMVLGLTVPHGANVSKLAPLTPVFLSHVLSFINLGIYWSNHHHLLQAVKQVDGKVLWANLHLLFWLSLFPFATAWMGENNFAALPVMLYGVILLFAAVAYFILTKALITLHGKDSTIAIALGKDFKGKISVVIYVLAIALCLLNRLPSMILYVLVAIMWLVPDRRIEKTLA
jgi:TMEM175 potassium channel family protein